MPSNETFIVAAYALTWLVLIAYAIRLWRATARARAVYERVAGSPRRESEQ